MQHEMQETGRVWTKLSYIEQPLSSKPINFIGVINCFEIHGLALMSKMRSMFDLGHLDLVFMRRI